MRHDVWLDLVCMPDIGAGCGLCSREPEAKDIGVGPASDTGCVNALLSVWFVVWLTKLNDMQGCTSAVACDRCGYWANHVPKCRELDIISLQVHGQFGGTRRVSQCRYFSCSTSHSGPALASVWLSRKEPLRMLMRLTLHRKFPYENREGTG